MQQKSTVPGYVVIGIGVVLVAIGFIWGFIVGFYPSEVPILLALLAAGAGTAWVGQRMLEAAKRANAEQRIAAREAENK